MLRPLSRLFSAASHPGLLVGLDRADDAAVYRLAPDLAVVQTVDFFAPVVDDPWTYGAIAAVNAMSDVWAMGGEVLFALNIAALPDDLDPEAAAAIFRGGAEMVAQAGAVIAGGHTVYDREPKYGLCVTGTVHPERVITKAGAQPGDLLLLTKPLGSGLIVTAARNGRAEAIWLNSAIEWMLRMNRHPSHLAVAAGVHAMTDITGFGLLGHADELARHSGVGLRLRAASVPAMDGARACIDMGVGTGGGERNRAFVEERVRTAAGVDPTVFELLYDPQTSGGLLLSISPAGAEELETRFAASGMPLWRIGEVLPGAGIEIVA